MTIHFITGNEDKLTEVKTILGTAVEVIAQKIDLEEIQSLSVSEVVSKKAMSAFEIAHEPVLIEDTGVYINALNGFPGALIKWLSKSLTNAGICELVAKYSDNTAYTETIYGLYDGKELETFRGVTEGTIAPSPRGEKGFGWDPIFIPNGSNLTYAEMGSEENNKMSSRKLALDQLRVHFNESK